MVAGEGRGGEKEEWPTHPAAGSRKMAVAITEPDGGSNSHKITTTAVRDGDDYLISGSKYYISGVDESAAILTVVRTGVAIRSFLIVSANAARSLTGPVTPHCRS